MGILDNEPLGDVEARELIREILENGTVYFSDHARGEMKEDDLDEIDCTNVLRAGWVDKSEWENGNWRYHVCSSKITVIVAFASETSAVIVTTWRNQ